MKTLLRVAAITGAVVLTMNLTVFAQRSGSTGKAGTGAPKVLQIDLDKLPPDLARALLREVSQQEKAQSGKKKTGRRNRKTEMKGAADAISLTEAIAIAEKAGKGRAINASRKDGLDYTHFTVQVVAPDGTSTRYTLSARGSILKQGQNRDRD
jgi:uncharacterized membrane protein YkoI